MSSAADAAGARGEVLFWAAATKPPAGTTMPALRPTHLGEKWELFDFLVEVVSPGRRPFAFVSVRATHKPRTATGKLSVPWSRKEILDMQRFPAPTYLAGVDLNEDSVFLLSANGLTGRLNSLSSAHRVDSSLNPRWRDEIVAAWAGARTDFPSEFL